MKDAERLMKERARSSVFHICLTSCLIISPGRKKGGCSAPRQRKCKIVAAEKSSGTYRQLPGRNIYTHRSRSSGPRATLLMSETRPFEALRGGGAAGSRYQRAAGGDSARTD